jgi:hypothetical protein
VGQRLLNDCLALAEWARQHGYALVRRSAVRGSRQSFNMKLATTILDNVNACLKYDDQVRVGGDPNQASHCGIMPLTISRKNSVSYSPTPRHAIPFVYAPSVINKRKPPHWQCHIIPISVHAQEGKYTEKNIYKYLAS